MGSNIRIESCCSSAIISSLISFTWSSSTPLPSGELVSRLTGSQCSPWGKNILNVTYVFFSPEVWLSSKRSSEHDTQFSKCCSRTLEFGHYLGRGESAENVAQVYGGLNGQERLEMGLFYKLEWIRLSNQVSVRYLVDSLISISITIIVQRNHCYHHHYCCHHLRGLTVYVKLHVRNTYTGDLLRGQSNRERLGILWLIP